MLLRPSMQAVFCFWFSGCSWHPYRRGGKLVRRPSSVASPWLETEHYSIRLCLSFSLDRPSIISTCHAEANQCLHLYHFCFSWRQTRSHLALLPNQSSKWSFTTFKRNISLNHMPAMQRLACLPIWKQARARLFISNTQGCQMISAAHIWPWSPTVNH
jgi:hypothetical protein